MKKIILAMFVLGVYVNIHAQEMSLPKNPKKGECYIRCYKEVNGVSKWTKTPCDLFKKDSSQIKAVQYKLINLGYKIEPTGCVNIETSEAYVDFKNNRKALKRKLRKEKRKKKKSN